MNGVHGVKHKECFFPQCVTPVVDEVFRVERVEVIGGIAVERGKKVPVCGGHFFHYEARAEVLRCAGELRGLPDRIVSPFEVVGVVMVA